MQQIFRNATCGDSSGVYRTDTLIWCIFFGMIFRQFWKLSCHQVVLFWMICGSCWINISVLLTLWLDTISMTWILFKAMLSAVFTKDTFIPINHILMLHHYISPVAEALMNAVCLMWILFIHHWQFSFRQTVAMISWTWLTPGACLIDTAHLWLMPWRTTYPRAVGLFGSYFSSLLLRLHSQFYKTTCFSH
jgi:hypothetical protein